MMKLYEGEMVENYLIEQDIKKPNCLIFQIGKKGTQTFEVYFRLF